MIGVSVMSGCPVKCPFCATGALKRWRNLTAEEIFEQVQFIVDNNKNKFLPENAKEFRVLFTRMGEPVLNRDEVIRAISFVKEKWPNATIAVSTVGPKAGTQDFFEKLKKLNKKFGGDFIQLQFSVHSTDESQRDFLQPILKFTLEEITAFADDWEKQSARKLTLNFTLCGDNEFSAEKIHSLFPRKNVFLKLSPLNDNLTSRKNGLTGIISAKNLA